MEKNLILIAGLPGTGKTTTAQKIYSNLEDYKLISQNDIRREFGIKKMPKTQDTTLRKIDMLIAQFLSDGQGVISESVNRYLFRRHQMYGVASCCGKKVITLECVCSEKEAKQRIKRRPKKDNLISDPNNPSVYNKLSKSWEPIIKDFKYPGEDHVSYIIYDTEKNKLKRKIVGKGMGIFINKLEKILLKNIKNASDI